MSESREKLNLLFENIRRKTTSVTCHLIIYAGLPTARGTATNQIEECQRTLKKVGGVTAQLSTFKQSS